MQQGWFVDISTQVYMLDRKIWKLFRLSGNGGKGTKCDQFFCPTSNFSDFCNPCFFYHTFTNDVDFVDKAYMQKSMTTVCLHCSFAVLKNKHLGVLGTNVATTSWLYIGPQFLGIGLQLQQHLPKTLAGCGSTVCWSNTDTESPILSLNFA